MKRESSQSPPSSGTSKYVRDQFGVVKGRGLGSGTAGDHRSLPPRVRGPSADSPRPLGTGRGRGRARKGRVESWSGGPGKIRGGPRTGNQETEGGPTYVEDGVVPGSGRGRLGESNRVPSDQCRNHVDSVEISESQCLYNNLPFILVGVLLPTYSFYHTPL